MSCKKSISENDQTNTIREHAEINSKRRVDEFDEGLIKIPSDPRLAYKTGLILGFTDCADLIHQESHEQDVFLKKRPKETENWNQVRIQAAIAAMQGFCANPNYFKLNSRATIPEAAIVYSDDLIEKLKGE